MIKQWLERRRKARRLAEFRKGFEYAAGRLLEGTDPELVTCDLEVLSPYACTGFDDGAAAAIVRWSEQFTEWPEVRAA